MAKKMTDDRIEVVNNCLHRPGLIIRENLSTVDYYGWPSRGTDESQMIEWRQTMQRIRRNWLAIVGFFVFLVATTVRSQAQLDDRQLLRLVGDAVADQSNRGAFRQVVQNYDRYRQLVKEGRIPAANVEVFDNQLWSLGMKVWDDVKAAHPEGLERVDLVGSGGRRLEAGSKYIVGKSDLDFIPRGPEAEKAAQEFMKRLTAELGGTDPQKIGLNALSPVQAAERGLIEAANHPEKYCTPERLKVLDYQQYSSGMTVVWEGGKSQRVSVRDLYASNGWPPPPEPTALDAFGAAAAEGKFLNESARKGLTGAEKAIYEAKYHTRTLDSAVKLGGVEVPAGSEAVERELRAIAESKSVRTALSERIARHGGNVESAVAEYLQEVSQMNKQVTTDLLRKHLNLIREKAGAGGEALVEAQKAIGNLKHSLAIFSDSQTRKLLTEAGIKPATVETVAKEAAKFRGEVAIEGERAAIEARKLARILAWHVPPAERAAFEAQMAGLTKNAAGRSLLENIAETMRANPKSSALIALAAVIEVRHLAQVAGEKGGWEFSRELGKAATDWYLMGISPHYAVTRLTIGLGMLGVEIAYVGPIKEATAREAYEGDAGFLGHIGLTRGELTRQFATEAEALKAARDWYKYWMTLHAEFLGKEEIEEAFIRQVRADYESSRWLQMARDYSFDPKTGQYGENGFFRRMGKGAITFENFAARFRSEEAVQNAIKRYLDDFWSPDWEKYGIKPGERAAREEMLRKYLLELWKASAKFNAELKKARDEAIQQADGSDDELVKTLLGSPADGDTASIDEIRRLRSAHDALLRTWPLLRKLERMAQEIRDEVAAVKQQSAVEASGKRVLDAYADAIDADRAFLDKTEQQLAALRAAIARGALRPATAERLQAELKAVKAEADRITASADRALAEGKAGRTTVATVRQQCMSLLERYRQAKDRFAPAHAAVEQLSYLSGIRQEAESYRMFQRRIGEHVLNGRDLLLQLQSTADGMDDRITALQRRTTEFNNLKAKLETLVGELRDKAGQDTAEEMNAQRLQAQLSACVIPAVPESQARAAAVALQQLGDRWQERTAAKPRRAVDFEEFTASAAVARELLDQLILPHGEAFQALEEARAAIARLAEFITSRPTEPKPTETVRENHTKPKPTETVRKEPPKPTPPPTIPAPPADDKKAAGNRIAKSFQIALQRKMAKDSDAKEQYRLEIVVPLRYENGSIVGAYRFMQTRPGVKEWASFEWGDAQNPGRVAVGDVVRVYSRDNPDLPWK